MTKGQSPFSASNIDLGVSSTSLLQALDDLNLTALVEALKQEGIIPHCEGPLDRRVDDPDIEVKESRRSGPEDNVSDTTALPCRNYD